MKKTIILTWVSITLFGLTPLTRAEVLTMPQTEEAAEPAEAMEPAPAPEPIPSEASSHAVPESTSLTVPGRGMTMEQVEARFGAPNEKIPAVGEPPIARWVYGNYTVYFERDIVLHSVTHHR